MLHAEMWTRSSRWNSSETTQAHRSGAFQTVTPGQIHVLQVVENITVLKACTHRIAELLVEMPLLQKLLCVRQGHVVEMVNLSGCMSCQQAYERNNDSHN